MGLARLVVALALLLLAGPAAAAGCVGADPEGADDPATAEAFQACQAKQRKAFIKSVTGRTGRAPTEAALERFDDRARAEAATYFSRHTQTGDDPSPAPAAAEKASDHVSVEKAGGADAKDVDALKAAMVEKSEGGKKGVTPEMADDMRKFLEQRQGSVSPDMERLLQSTSRDGANLTQGTMQQLRGAAKQAKGQGLDLGIDPSMEKALLHDDLEPAPGAPKPGEPGTN